MTLFSEDYIQETFAILSEMRPFDIERVVDEIARVRQNQGRLFVLGVGGSAATASHAVNDFRKLCAVECYTPSDNVAELTARVNDDGWNTAYAEWLRISRLDVNDAILVLSVGGGGGNVSQNIVQALDLARLRGAKILGIVSRDGGVTARVADACVMVPPLFDNHITPHCEGITMVLLHLFCSHPRLSRTN